MYFAGLGCDGKSCNQEICLSVNLCFGSCCLAVLPVGGTPDVCLPLLEELIPRLSPAPAEWSPLGFLFCFCFFAVLFLLLLFCCQVVGRALCCPDVLSSLPCRWGWSRTSVEEATHFKSSVACCLFLLSRVCPSLNSVSPRLYFLLSF
jgi:hypothetical protein